MSKQASLAEVASQKAKVLRSWLVEIEELEGGDPEEREDAVSRFVMRMKNFLQQTDDLLQD